MSRRRIIVERFGDAFTGWLAGVGSTLVLGVLWPFIFPAIVRIEHYYGAGPGMPLIVAIAVVVASPAAALGGLIGGALSVEGGDSGRRMIAIVAGIVLSLPCAGWGYWFFTGY